MVVYTCPLCKKEFDKKSNYVRHVIYRKKPCVDNGIMPLENKQNCKRATSERVFSGKKSQKKSQKKQGGKFTCPHCFKNFTRKDSVSRHIKKTCNMVQIKSKKMSINNICSSDIYPNNFGNDSNNNNNHLQNIYGSINYLINIMQRKTDNNLLNTTTKAIMTSEEKYEKKIKKLEEKLLEHEHKMEKVRTSANNTQNNIQNIKHQNINNINNIKMVAFGDEDLSFISDGIYKKLIGRGFNSVPSLIKYVHFNKKKPEFHNVFVSNNQNSFTYAYNGNGWGVMSKKEVIRQLIDDSSDLLIDKFRELKGELPDSAIKKFKKYMSKRNEYETLSWIEKQVKMILYNNRNMPMELKKKMFECIK